MCGIAGVVGKKAINRKAIKEMTDIMSHRGPDGEGLWSNIDDRVCLGHRRLAIIDTSEMGHQPMIDNSGRFVITFNGEIYNFIEIRTQLKALGVQFESDSDTEVILESYKHWGKNCLSKLNGMFSFVLYDIDKGLLFCARDRYGEKPFLFSIKDDFFAFASEYKALLQLKEISSDIDEFRVIRAAYNHSTGLDADRQTVFDDIQQLLPSEALIFNIKTFELNIWRYWDVSINDQYANLSFKAASEMFLELFTDSIKIRLRSDVPLGSCLSGGLDSSAIVSIIKKKILVDTDYKTFTGVFPGTHADEWKYAKDIIDDTNVSSFRVEPSSAALAKELDDFIWFNELPVGSTSQYAQYNVFRLAKQNGITVLLDGQGADEILGGYEQYFRFYVNSLKDLNKDQELNNELPLIRKRYPLALKSDFQKNRENLPYGVRYFIANSLNMGSAIDYGMKYSTAVKVRKIGKIKRESRFNALASELYHDSFGGYLNTLLRYGDRNSMAHSREVRLPFCDHRIAELALSLPPEYLMGEVQTKRLLRDSMNGILHNNIRSRWNKQGFRPPQELWFVGEMLNIAEELLNSESFRRNEFWNSKWWITIINRVKNGETGLSWSLWHPFIIEGWKEHFLNRIAKKDKISVFQ